MKFSDVVKNKLSLQRKSIAWLARKMECSYQYLWRLIKKKKGRWNEDLMFKACELLHIEIKFVDKPVKREVV